MIIVDMMGYGEFGHTIYTKLGSGRFNNVYGRNGSYITAGQQDYAERLNQIESQKEDYYKELGIAPGVPTMKGAYGDPENTGVGYNTIITELGDHSVPKNWAQFVVKREPGETPGPPIIWSDPQNPEDAQPGYGFIPDETTDEETFFYHSDHLGSTSYITDQDGNITQYTAYLPYGELLVDEHSSSENLPYKFNGKELDEETGLYYYGARYLQPVASIWYGADPLFEDYPQNSPYTYCMGNSLKYVDPDGKTGDVVYNKDGTAIVYAKLYFYGNAANSDLSKKIATGIASQWNGAHATITYRNKTYKVIFRISYETISEQNAKTIMNGNNSARNNFIRVEDGPTNQSSFTITNRRTGGGNSFWFNTKDDLANSTTPAHEFGHGLGLEHPRNDFRNTEDKPNIMIPRNTSYGNKWSLKKEDGTKIVNPNSRRVTQENVEDAYWSNWGNYRNNKSVNIFIDKNGTY